MYLDPYAFFGPALAPDDCRAAQVRSIVAAARGSMTTGVTAKTVELPSSNGADSNIRIQATPSPQPNFSPDPARRIPPPLRPPHPTPSAHGRSRGGSPSFLKIMESIRAADSAESVDAQRELYAKVVTQLGQFMPAVPLLNVTSKVAVSRSRAGLPDGARTLSGSSTSCACRSRMPPRPAERAAAFFGIRRPALRGGRRLPGSGS